MTSIRARWAAGIGCVEVMHRPPGRRRVYLRLDLEEAKELAEELQSVIEERRADDAHG